MVEGSFPKVDGDILFASEVNAFGNIQQIYTGTGFNSTRSTSGSTEGSHELTAIGVQTCKYVRISITGLSTNNGASAVETKTELKVQIKEVGGAYGDILAYQEIRVDPGTGNIGKNTVTYVVIHTLTAGEKTNGFQVKLFSKSTAEAANGSASFVNSQSVLELVNGI